MFLTWVKICPSCPVCGFRLDRHEPGYWLGSLTVNIFATEGVIMTLLVAVMFATWPEVPWDRLETAGLVAAIGAPVFVFPFTKMFYLAVDLCFRPPEPPDLATPIERGFLAPRPTPTAGSTSG